MRSVLFVTRESQADRRFGLGKSILPICEALSRRGWRSRYLCRQDLTPRAQARLDTVTRWLQRRLPARLGATDLRVLAAIYVERLAMGYLAAHVARAEGYGHVHCHDPIIGLGFWVFSVFGHRGRPRWGVSQHGFGCYVQAIQDEGFRMGPWLTRWLRRLEAATLAQAQWLLTPTAAGLAMLARDLGLSPLPPHWHAVPHARPLLNRYHRADARMRLGWDTTACYIVSVGRLVPLKQLPLLIEAVAGLRSERPVRLVLLGEGDQTPLLARAAELGVALPIIEVTDDVGLYLCAADCYISVSLTESFGMANLEAVLLGVPAICPAVGGVPEVVSTGAWLIPPTMQAARAALQTLLDEPATAQALTRRAQALAQTWPDADEIAARYEHVYG